MNNKKKENIINFMEDTKYKEDVKEIGNNLKRLGEENYEL